MRPFVLIIDDDESFAHALKKTHTTNGMVAQVAHSPAKALEIYHKSKMDIDLLIIDYHFSDTTITGSDLALKIRSMNRNQPIVFMTGHNEIQYLESMLQTGVARTFVRKGMDLKMLIEPILKVISEIVKSPKTDDTIEDELKRASEIGALGMAGRSVELHRAVQLITKVRLFRSQFMIIGSTGSGKELLAQAFKLPGKPFVGINCARFGHGGEQFLESELFGHRKGAYTGADHDVTGAFECAKGGIIFFDELHHLSLSAQARLLRAIQENRFRKLGDPSGPERIIDTTIVSATKPNIFTMIENGQFMPDLYFRLAKTEVYVPDLNERKTDIRPLSEFFAQKVGNRLRLNIEFEPGVIREMESYRWPGNVRELSGFIEGAAMASEVKGLVTITSFRNFLAQKARTNAQGQDQEPIELGKLVQTIESERIIASLKKSRTVGLAAKLLGVARTTLNDKMKRLGIDPRKFLQVDLALNHEQSKT